jgi:hypothetical protein
MLKYLVGTYDQPSWSFMGPYRVIRAKTREDAVEKYETMLNLVSGSGRVMALVTLFGPMNLDPQCSLEVAKEAMKSAMEVEE